jgi:hypothetical protein
MKRMILLIVAVLAMFAAGVYRPESTNTQAKETDLVVHEWGTFTSIAGRNGVALDWRPLNGPSDLPTFVYNVNGNEGYRGTRGFSGKGEISRVRMETPVIYFYTKKEMQISVSVQFPKGQITEWYPQAGAVNANYSARETGRFHSGITWGQIKLMPNAPENYMREAAYSHYYPARETDAVPIQVCNVDRTRIEHEKFLFYRGIGNFDLPLNVKLEGDQVVLSENAAAYRELMNPPKGLVDLVVFENRGGRIGYTYVSALNGDSRIARPLLDKSLDQVYSQLGQSLQAHGLYEKEAKAMISTWTDSWFEEGLRVFYILPRRLTDEILPLRIDAPAQEIVRVLVGRAEVVTPEMERDVRRQVTLLRSPSENVRQTAREELMRRGRFYEPILRSILANEPDASVRAQIEQLIAMPS